MALSRFKFYLKYKLFLLTCKVRLNLFKSDHLNKNNTHKNIFCSLESPVLITFASPALQPGIKKWTYLCTFGKENLITGFVWSNICD